MAVTPGADALSRLKAAAMCGARELEPALAPGVRLDASLAELPRTRRSGTAAVLAELARWWPGEGTLVDWREQGWERGSAVTLERFDERGGLSRMRLYVHTDGAGRIAALWASSVQPRPAAAATPTGVPDAVLARLAPGGRREPLGHQGNSGAGLDRIVRADGSVLVAKRIAPGGDWIARATHDPGREALLPYERLPAPVVRVEPDPRGGWWVVMRDVGDGLVPARSPLSHADTRAMLAAAAGVHRAFAGGPRVTAACTLEHRLALHAPATGAAERGGCDVVPKQLEVGWEGFAAVAPPDVAKAVAAVLADPTPLAARLRAAAPSTLLHGDLRGDNVARVEGGVELIDWGLATWAPAAVELGWFLVHAAWRTAAPRVALLDDFRAAEGELHDERALRLGLLTALVSYGWLLGHSATVHPDPAEGAWARDEIAWLAEQTRPVLA